LDPSPRSQITTPEVLGDDETAESPRVRWRVVALAAAAAVPAVVFIAAFPALWDLITGLTSLVVFLYWLAATLQGRDGDDLPPASAAFLAAADPTRPLDGSFASTDAALAPTAASPVPEPLSARPAPEPLSAPALKPPDSIPARELIGHLLFRRAEAGTRARPAERGSIPGKNPE
jgi:hypothetical protein